MKPKSFSAQFLECQKEGFTDEKEFFRFRDHPYMLPACPTLEMARMIEQAKWKGINLIKCGKFGGLCSSKNKKCQKLRNIEDT